MIWERDLVFLEESPINQIDLPIKKRYQLTIDNKSEIIDKDKNGCFFYDFDEVKLLFDQQLKLEDTPFEMSIEVLDENSIDFKTDEVLVWNRLNFIQKSLRMYHLLNASWTLSEDENLELLTIKVEFNEY